MGEVAGPNAVAFINLGPAHTYMEKQQAAEKSDDKGQDDKAQPKAPPKPQTVAYPRLAAALSKPVKDCLGRRGVHGLYQVREEDAHRRALCLCSSQQCSPTSARASVRREPLDWSHALPLLAGGEGGAGVRDQAGQALAWGRGPGASQGVSPWLRCCA